MKILVTGGAGFIGSHATDFFLREGHEVHVVDDLSSGRLANISDNAVFHQLDISDPKTALLIQNEKFEVLAHFAAQINVRHSVADPVFDAQVNVLGLLRLMEAGRKSGLKKMIFASTGGAIYGEPDYTPQDEEHAIRPKSPYGLSKLTSEKYLQYYEQVYGIASTSLRFANVYGPRQNAKGEAGVIAIFISKLLAGETVFIYGDGNQTRDYVYVEDVVEAMRVALEKNEGGTYNIGTGVETSVNTLYDRLKTIISSNATARHEPGRPGEQKRSVLSFDKILRELEWRPSITVQEGLVRTVEWFKSRTDGES